MALHEASAHLGKVAGGAAARAEFIGACQSTAQAWYGTNLLAMAKRRHVKRSREVLQAGDAVAIVELMQDIGGPVAPPNPREALGHAVHQHKEAAGLLARLAVRRAVLEGGPMRDQLERMKDDLASWIEHGSFIDSSACADRNAIQAEAIAQLIARTAHADDVSEEDVARLRLAIVAPLAPPLESLLVIARLDEGFVQHAPDWFVPAQRSASASEGDGAPAADIARNAMRAGRADQPAADAPGEQPREQPGDQPGAGPGRTPVPAAGFRGRLSGVMSPLARWRSRQG